MDCLGKQEAINRYLDGDMSPGERTDLEAHLAQCHLCQSDLASTGAVFSVLSELRDAAVPSGFRDSVLAGLPQARATRVVRWIVAVQAAVTVALLVLAYPTLSGWYEAVAEWLERAQLAAMLAGWVATGMDLWHRTLDPLVRNVAILVSRERPVSWAQAALALVLFAGLCFLGNVLLLRNGHRRIGGMT